jgi:hypothetical protein
MKSCLTPWLETFSNFHHRTIINMSEESNSIAAEAVFALPELVESIIVQLPPRKIFATASRVSKHGQLSSNALVKFAKTYSFQPRKLYR